MLLLIIETNRYSTLKNVAIEYSSLLNLEAYTLIISGLVQYLVECNCNSTFEIIVLLTKMLVKRFFKLMLFSLRLLRSVMYISRSYILLYIIFLNLSSLKVLMDNLHIETCVTTRYNKSCLLWICALTFNILSLFICCLNIKLLVICNCNISLRNPGPNNNIRPLSVLYSNVQGLINAGDLASEIPPLNITKLHELHGYLYIHKPDVLILNETWLKKPILDSEILPSSYNIIRLDRSLKTHPWILIIQKDLGKMVAVF